MTGRRVCFVTCRTWPEISESDSTVARALERRGATVTGLPWNDGAARFDDFDVVVLRSNWDYHLEPERFLDWLAARERAGTNLWNTPALVRWNVSKDYLLDLSRRGVRIVPTAVLDGDEASLTSVIARRGWSDVVVKPLISASANETRLVRADEAAAAEADVRRDAKRRRLIVQPFVSEIRTRGEWSCVFIDGELTHAVLKVPADGDYRVQPRFGGLFESRTPPSAVADAARKTLEALPASALYARIDGIETESGFVLMEVEVNEPGLFFVQSPRGAERFAEAICRRMTRT